jgi:hypothetical protein
VAEGIEMLSVEDAAMGSNTEGTAGEDVGDAGMPLDAVTVTNTTFTTVLVLAEVGGVVNTEDGGGDCVTVAVDTITTVETDVNTEDEPELVPGDKVVGTDEGETEDVEIALKVLTGEADGVEAVDEPFEVVLASDAENGIELVVVAAALYSIGVGTRVLFGLGGGRPEGYEFWKISF